MKLNPTKHLGVGVQVQLPKKSVAGSIPAWAFYGGMFLLSAGGIAAWTIHSRQKSKAIVRAAEAKRDAVKIDCESKLALAKMKHGVSGKDVAGCGSTTMDTDDEDDDLPEWEDATSYSDRKVDSTLLGQSGGITIINGLEGQGKSTLAIQLMVEACEGKSSGLRKEDAAVVGSQWEGYLYASESSPKFKTCYGAKLEEICAGGVFKARINDPNLRNYKRVLRDIRKTAFSSKKNCVFGIDNVTDMFSKMAEREIEYFKNELEAIRLSVEKEGRLVQYFIVTHANSQTGDVAGSKIWQKTSEINIFILEDKKADNPDCKIIHIKKNRLGAQRTIRVRRVMTPYMHFEYCKDCNSDKTLEIALPDKHMTQEDSRKPITPEVENLFARVYVKGSYGYGRIYNDYKQEFQLNRKDDVRNAIERVRSRAKVA